MPLQAESLLRNSRLLDHLSPTFDVRIEQLSQVGWGLFKGTLPILFFQAGSAI
jgi:hypothetical protein